MCSRSTLATLATVAVAVSASCADDGAGMGGPAEPAVILDLGLIDDVVPGDVIAMRSDGSGGVEWIERQTGRIVGLPDVAALIDQPATADAVEVLGTVDVTGSDGARQGGQRGLLGQTVVDGVRYVAWTDPETTELLIGAMPVRPATSDDAGREQPTGPAPTMEWIVWNGGPTASGAVGGHLATIAFAGGSIRLVLGVGQLTDWAKANGSGAIVTLDPAGPADQEPTILSDGYVNPFAFDSVAVDDDDDGGGGGEFALWVADNAVGDDSERIGRGDTIDRGEHRPTGVAPRAPSALITLPDGRIGICGFLDGELQTWRVTGDDGSALPAPEQGEALGPCLTGAAVVRTGDDARRPLIVTASADALVAFDTPT